MNITEINRSEVLRYLGYRENINIDNISQIMDKCEEKLLETIKPRFVYKIFPIKIENNQVIVENTSLVLTGNSILKHLEGCHSIVLLSVTISNSIDTLIAQYEVVDMTYALIADSMASVVIEQVCDNAEDEIREKLSDKYMTWRFSPGYGDLPIDLQRKFVAVTDAEKRIGLTVNEGGILIPRKSVTAILGISDTPIPKKRQGCAYCNMNKTCEFRKGGSHCGF